MAQRAIAAGFADGPAPRQHLSQNAEFCLIHDAWQKRTFELTPTTSAVHQKVYSDLLVNRAPAYSVRGGLFDILVETNGVTYAVPYGEAARADELFRETEGIDPLSPGAVALPVKSTISVSVSIRFGATMTARPAPVELDWATWITSPATLLLETALAVLKPACAGPGRARISAATSMSCLIAPVHIE